MSESPSHDPQSVPPPKSTVVLLLGDIADTTWRMFGPVIILALLGMWLDSMFRSGPWLALGGALIGCIGAGYLIKQQLSKVQRS